MEKLYQIIPAAPDIDVAGILVALVYRLMTIAVAAVGTVIYWSHRGEVRSCWRTPRAAKRVCISVPELSGFFQHAESGAFSP